MKFSILVLFAFPPTTLGQWAPGDPCPTAIEVTERRDETFTTMDSIHAAMLACPNIETLKMYVGFGGCMRLRDRQNLPFRLAGGERYASAPLALSLAGYAMDENEWEAIQREGPPWGLPLELQLNYWRRWLQRRFIPSTQRSKTNLDLWLDAMDFSRIHTLQLNESDGRYVLTDQVVQKLPSRLTSLKSLSVYRPIAEGFIVSLPRNSLRHLSWQNAQRSGWDCTPESREFSLEAVLRHHGASLVTLDYREEETMRCPPPPFSLSHLRQLASLAPNLKHLTIDLSREYSPTNGTQAGWPWSKLQTIASSFPSLTDLTIHFELASECQRRTVNFEPLHPDDRCDGPCVGLERLAQPLLNRASATEMARFLWRHNLNGRADASQGQGHGGQQLKSVSFRAGAWRVDGNERYFGPWLEGKRAWADCRLDWDDKGVDGEGSGSDVAVVCEAGDTLGLKDWAEKCHDRAVARLGVAEENSAQVALLG
ncbi:hypothetical protein VTK26DRAFT_6061 [Humicola hyalothermophila]